MNVMVWGGVARRPESDNSQMQKVCSENFGQCCAVCCGGVEARSMSGRRHAVGVAKMTGETDERHP